MNRFFCRITTVTAVCVGGAVLGALSSGCQHKLSAEEEKAAVTEFKGGNLPANEKEIMAKEKATAEAYRKAHPEKFPTDIKR